LDPALTLAGAAFVTETSAEVVIVVFAVEELFPGFESVVALETIAVLESVPAAVPELMFTVSVNAAEEPAVSVAIEQVMVAPVVQLKLGPEFCWNETNVAPGGMASVSETDWASARPLFVTLIAYATLVPALALAGPLLVTARSADAVTVVLALELLLPEFESEKSELAVAVLVMRVPSGVEDEMATVIVNCALTPLPSEATPQATVPPGL
jgi:hypothetical protein